MKSIPGGEKDIREYYRIAPAIVSAVNEREDAEHIWSRVYHDLILKCVNLIETGDYDRTYQLYKDYTFHLQELYL